MVLVGLRVLDGNDREVSVSVWVDTDDIRAAGAGARELARTRGWRLLGEEAGIATDRSDYFPPCPGLAALERAERDGIAFRLHGE